MPAGSHQGDYNDPLDTPRHVRAVCARPAHAAAGAGDAMTRKPAEAIKIGDIILPPERELRLWMRRYAQEHDLAEAALHLTVLEVREGNPDKGGRWLIVKTRQTDEWAVGRRNLFSFKARPHTPWQFVVTP